MAADDSDLLSFEPLYPDQDEATILARWQDWANEGRDPAEDVEHWTPTNEGTMWWVHTTPGRREAARMYDLLGTEVVAAAFPQWSWGSYLDDHAELREVGRLPATAADGEVTFTGDPGTVIAAGTVVAVEPVDPDAEAPEYETTAAGTIPAAPPDPGTVTVPIVARETGEESNVGIGAVTSLPVPPAGVLSVTNAAPITGGTDPESDPALKQRVLESFVGAAVANQLYYRREALAEPGVGRATVLPATPGAGQILIVVATAEGDPVAEAVRAGLQERLDPTPGQGAGDGQVGATITVATATALVINVTGTVEFESGYSMDSQPGLIPMRDAIVASIASYTDSVPSGGEVVLKLVERQVTRLVGVHDIAGFTLNGGTVNIQVPSDPPRVPALGDTSGIVGGNV